MKKIFKMIEATIMTALIIPKLCVIIYKMETCNKKTSLKSVVVKPACKIIKGKI